MPGAKVASTRRIFSAAVQRRRRWTEVMISTRSEVLVIGSVISLTLPKWETLSGQFGGNLRTTPPLPSVGSNWVPARTRNRFGRPFCWMFQARLGNSGQAWPLTTCWPTSAPAWPAACFTQRPPGRFFFGQAPAAYLATVGADIATLKPLPFPASAMFPLSLAGVETVCKPRAGGDMANTKHLALILQGAAAWNAWRAAHPKTSPDLLGAP